MFQSLQKYIHSNTAEGRISNTRLVSKNGHCNIEFGNINYSSHFAFLADFWTTFVEIRWRYVLLLFNLSFMISWFTFGLLWFWIAASNNDLWWQTRPNNHVPCITNVDGLSAAFLYSVETQTTIGYGVRIVTPQCAMGLVLFVIQCLIGTIINSVVVGVMMAKIALPKKRAKTVTFSETAVICPKNGNLCLQVRVANLRKTLLIGSQIYGKLLRTTVTPEGETIIMDQANVDFVVDMGKDNLFFICPLMLFHVIDKNSPLFEVAADTLHQQEFELVVFLEGTAESTSASCQVRTSYLPQEIQWGSNFLPIISRTKEGKYCVDFSNFSKTMPVATPHCAHCLHHEKEHHHSDKRGRDNKGFEMVEVPQEIATITKM